MLIAFDERYAEKSVEDFLVREPIVLDKANLKSIAQDCLIAQIAEDEKILKAKYASIENNDKKSDAWKKQEANQEQMQKKTYYRKNLPEHLQRILLLEEQLEEQQRKFKVEEANNKRKIKNDIAKEINSKKKGLAR